MPSPFHLEAWHTFSLAGKRRQVCRVFFSLLSPPGDNCSTYLRIYTIVHYPDDRSRGELTGIKKKRDSAENGAGRDSQDFPVPSLLHKIERTTCCQKNSPRNDSFLSRCRPTITKSSTMRQTNLSIRFHQRESGTVSSRDVVVGFLGPTRKRPFLGNRPPTSHWECQVLASSR